MSPQTEFSILLYISFYSGQKQITVAITMFNQEYKTHYINSTLMQFKRHKAVKFMTVEFKAMFTVSRLNL